MQRAYEDDNGTPSERATFNLQRRQARQSASDDASYRRQGFAGSDENSPAVNNLIRRNERAQDNAKSSAADEPARDHRLQPGQPPLKPRGFQIHKVQAAAQAAKGNQYTGPDDDGAD